MWLWGASRGRDWVAVRRSRWFLGLIPHFAVFRARGRYCLHVEYVPRRERGDPKGKDDAVLIFNGRYRASLYRRVAVVYSDTYEDSVRGVFGAVGRSLRHAKTVR